MTSAVLSSTIPTWPGAFGERQIPTWPTHRALSAAKPLPGFVSGQQLCEWCGCQKELGFSLRASVDRNNNVFGIVPACQNGLASFVGNPVKSIGCRLIDESAGFFVEGRAGVQVFQVTFGKVVQSIRNILNDLVEIVFVAAKAIALDVKFQAADCDLSFHCLISVLRRAVPAASCEDIYNGHITASTEKCTMGTFFRKLIEGVM